MTRIELTFGVQHGAPDVVEVHLVLGGFDLLHFELVLLFAQTLVVGYFEVLLLLLVLV